MAELILYRGSKRITVPPVSDTCYLYRIGPGQVDGGKFIDLNDERRLNALAKEIRDDYSCWIYSLNDLFLPKKRVMKDTKINGTNVPAIV